MRSVLRIIPILAATCLLTAVATAGPPETAGPLAPHHSVRSVDALPRLATAPFDRELLRAEDLERRDAGLPPRFALPEEVFVTPATGGVWERLDGDRDVWRLRVQAPGALSLNFGFTAYRLPAGGRLTIHPARDLVGDDPRGVRVFTERDNEDHGQLWSPVVLADDVVIELVLPRAARHDYELALTAVNRGYRLFGETPDKAGYCNVDVICPEGDPWRREINSVAVYSTGGSLYCTGFMVNNTAQDGTPYFQTAYHCGINTGNAASLVVYWNFQSPVCGQQGGGSLADYQTGAIFRAAASATDFTLLELDDPANPAHEVSYAGWNRSSDDFPSVVAIHHPSSDEKSISFEDDPTTTTSYADTAVPGDGNYIRVIDWDLGTTEPGSSGSPLFDPNHRVVGQLRGGWAACGNNSSDWYGRVSVSWNGVNAATRLRDWLDPGDTGALVLDTFAPWSSGLQVAPNSDLAAVGPVGGPFVPIQVVYTLTNDSQDTALDWSAAADVGWVDVTPGAGSLPPTGTVDVTVALNSAADGLPFGNHTGSVSFLNLTDGDGDTSRALSLQAGIRGLVHSEHFDADPGWLTSGQWAHGAPAGGGGEFGGPDPVAGFTGGNVYGYNLAGDYENNLAQTNLISAPFNCSQVQSTVLRFHRWLGVDDPAFDHAAVAVSADGATFTTVWENDGEIADMAWTPLEIDISAVADGSSFVFVRWAMGTTDGSRRYCGWNIDDVEIWGLVQGVSAAGDLPAVPLQLTSHPNPFNPSTQLVFALAAAGHARLEVYDTAGRRVATLVDRALAAGSHTVTWQPRQLPSGVYLARLRTDGEVAVQRMTLLK